MKKRNTVIINMYHPPDRPTEKFSSILTELRTKLIEIGNPMPNIIFTGDLNFPIIDWQMETARSKSGSRKCLFEICTGTILTAIYRGANEKK